MKLIDTLRNIWYAATHANQLIDESTKYHRLLNDQEADVETRRDEWESEEENVQKSCTVTPAKDLPQGWQWEDHRDPGGGDGYLKSPDGRMYFPYVLEPHSTGAEEELEYFDLYRQYEQVLPETGKLSDFKAYAESEMKRNLLSRDEEEKEWKPLPKYTQAKNLPQGWQWVDYGDASGHLQSPDGESYFGYDRQSYYHAGGIEYQVSRDRHYTAFWGTMEDFKTYAESVINAQYLPQQDIQNTQINPEQNWELEP